MTTLAAPPDTGGLLAPDPAVPTRDLLLDPRAAARRLEHALGGAAIRRCERVRAKYRVGESLRVLYRLTVRGRTVPVSVRTFSACRGSEAFQRALADATPAGPLPPVAHDPELGAVLWTFPNDRRIRDLPLLASPTSLGELLGMPCATTRLTAYVPETQATARCLGAAGETVAWAKVYARDGAERTRRVAAALGGRHGALRLPRLLSAPHERALFLEPLSGRPLTALHGPPLERALRQLGAALAELHALPVPAGVPRHARLDGVRVRTAVGVIGFARPELAGTAEALARRLEATGGAPTRAVCVHGDLHLNNALARPDGIALVDLDDVTAGEPEADLARVLAGLAYAAVLGQLPATAERELGRALLAGYGRGATPPRDGALRWHVAATLLARNAATAVSRCRRSGLERLDAVLGRAEEELA
jgi:aminoglycoside phosphotransferase